MSRHYEWVLSLWLRPDTPPEFLDELRWHLGLTTDPPAAPTLRGEDWPVFAHGGDGLPGGTICVLESLPPRWGLYVRTLTLDDAMYEWIQTVPPWLARWSATEGWIGYAREEMHLHAWLHFYAQGGHAYGATPGGRPEALVAGAPPFTARYTCDY